MLLIQISVLSQPCEFIPINWKKYTVRLYGTVTILQQSHINSPFQKALEHASIVRICNENHSTWSVTNHWNCDILLSFLSDNNTFRIPIEFKMNIKLRILYVLILFVVGTWACLTLDPFNDAHDCGFAFDPVSYRSRKAFEIFSQRVQITNFISPFLHSANKMMNAAVHWLVRPWKVFVWLSFIMRMYQNQFLPKKTWTMARFTNNCLGIYFGSLLNVQIRSIYYASKWIKISIFGKYSRHNFFCYQYKLLGDRHNSRAP